MQSITQEVTNTSGVKATIKTVKDPTETVDQWLTRHAAAVTAFEAS